MSTLLLDAERAVHHVMRTARLTARVPAVARDWLTGILTQAALPTDTAQLVLSELATNAVLHAEPPLQIDVQVESGALLRLAVTDRPPAQPKTSDLPDDEHGLGLGIVHSLCVTYTERTADGRHTVEVTIELNGEQQ